MGIKGVGAPNGAVFRWAQRFLVPMAVSFPPTGGLEPNRCFGGFSEGFPIDPPQENQGFKSQTTDPHQQNGVGRDSFFRAGAAAAGGLAFLLCQTHCPGGLKGAIGGMLGAINPMSLFSKKDEKARQFRRSAGWVEGWRANHPKDPSALA